MKHMLLHPQDFDSSIFGSHEDEIFLADLLPDEARDDADVRVQNRLEFEAVEQVRASGPGMETRNSKRPDDDVAALLPKQERELK